jgi:hypothetical protein
MVVQVARYGMLMQTSSISEEPVVTIFRGRLVPWHTIQAPSANIAAKIDPRKHSYGLRTVWGTDIRGRRIVTQRQRILYCTNKGNLGLRIVMSRYVVNHVTVTVASCLCCAVSLFLSLSLFLPASLATVFWHSLREIKESSPQTFSFASTDRRTDTSPSFPLWVHLSAQKTSPHSRRDRDPKFSYLYILKT